MLERIKKFKQVGKPFTSMVPVFPVPRDPSSNFPTISNPHLIRKFVWVGVGGEGVPQPGLFYTDAFSGQTCSFEVDSYPDMTQFTENLVIELGPYRLLPYIHYTPEAVGLGYEDATATAIAAAISLLPLFSATTAGPVVNVVYNGNPNDKVWFRILQNITPLTYINITPTNGYLVLGTPIFGPPEIG